METISGLTNWRLAVKREESGVTILRAVTCDENAVLPDELFGLPVTHLSDRALAHGAKPAEGEEVRARLLELVEEDAAAFFPLSQAYGIPKEDPTRAEVLEKCTKDALQGPLQMMREIARAIELLEEMNVKGSRMLISDVGCGAACAAAAMRAAAMNVFINTKSLQDRDFAQTVEAEADELLAYVPRAEATADEVTAGIRA